MKDCKVKFPLYLRLWHRGVWEEFEIPCICNISVRWRWVVSFTFELIYLWEKTESWVGHRTNWTRLKGEQSLLLLQVEFHLSDLDLLQHWLNCHSSWGLLLAERWSILYIVTLCMQLAEGRSLLLMCAVTAAILATVHRQSRTGGLICHWILGSVAVTQGCATLSSARWSHHCRIVWASVVLHPDDIWHWHATCNISGNQLEVVGYKERIYCMLYMVLLWIWE